MLQMALALVNRTMARVAAAEQLETDAQRTNARGYRMTVGQFPIKQAKGSTRAGKVQSSALEQVTTVWNSNV